MNCTGHQNCTLSPITLLSSTPFVTFILSLINGTLGILANAVTITVLLRNKKMRSPCFTLITGAASGSLLVALTHFVTNAAKIGDRIGSWSLSNRTRGACLLTNLYGLGCVAIPLSSTSVVLVALDRLFGTIAPIKYRLVAKKYTTVCLSLAFIFSVMVSVITIITGPPLIQIVSSCGLVNEALGHGPYVVFINISLTLEIFSVLSYIAMFISGPVRKWKMKNKVNGGFGSPAELQYFLKQQALVTPAAKMLFILYIITAVVPHITLNFVPVGGIYYNVVMQFYTAVTLVEFVSLTLRSKEFRMGLGRLIKSNSNQVTALAQKSIVRRQR